jgi:UDP-N-acetylmuramoyl-tripeptide--D-alanyl-D-alanine ligase
MHPKWGEITVGELLTPMGGTLVSGKRNLPVAGVCSDSRVARSGEIFWALQGERYDGHDFVQRAVQSGASCVVINASHLSRLRDLLQKERFGLSPAVVTVQDTLTALGNLAAWWRRQFEITLVAFTGSMGKTTTKEMCRAILQEGAKVLTSQGNYNNLIGVPLTLFRLHAGISRVVLELGMNQFGEIGRLTQITDPDVGVITNVARVHLEGVGDLKGVARAKCELIEASSSQTAIAVNGDDPLLMAAALKRRRDLFLFGLESHHQVYADEIRKGTNQEMGFVLHHKGGAWPVNLRVPGEHNVVNAVAASAAAFLMGAHPDEIVTGLEAFRGIKGRFAIQQLSCGVTVIDDSYNSNPEALVTALGTARNFVPHQGRLLAALGDMLELGEVASEAHKTAGRRAAEAGVAALVVLGSHAQEMIEGAVEAGISKKLTLAAETHADMVEFLSATAREGDIILFKGSRLMDLGRAVDLLKASLERRRKADAL